jgi:hypothetical protein
MCGFGALLESGSAIVRLSKEGDLWLGTVRADNTGASRLFCLIDFGWRCNEKETKNEETNFVKWMVKIVKGSLILAALAKRESIKKRDRFVVPLLT